MGYRDLSDFPVQPKDLLERCKPDFLKRPYKIVEPPPSIWRPDEKVLKSNSVSWEKICPALYREPWDWAKVFAKANRNALQRALEWSLKPRGIWVGGDSGRCKSRAVWSALERIHASGANIVALDGIEWGEKASEAARESRLHKWLKELEKPDVVFIDDWGKFRALNEPMAVATHGLLEKRSAAYKPTWFTTQLADNVIEAALSAIPHMEDSVLRRKNEFCEVVVV